MKRSHLMIAIFFAVSILMTSAVAQTGAIKANIPFDFTVAKQTFPAGEYKVVEQDKVLQLTRLDGPGSVLIPTYIAAYTNGDAPKLVFHRYATRSFLSQAWVGGVGHELIASPRELEYARTEKQEQVVVLASLLTK